MKEKLNDASTNFVLFEKSTSSNIVIGAPHHASGGVKSLQCPEHPVSDENTGLIGWAVADRLKAHKIIVCNATEDPNKKLSSEYAKNIIECNPQYLVEIHGHGGTKAPPNVIEISCGSNLLSKHAEKFAKKLQDKMVKAGLKKYDIKGTFDSLHFKAKNTATITHDKWLAFHIEIPPALRIDNNNLLPPEANLFIQALTDTIREICM